MDNLFGSQKPSGGTTAANGFEPRRNSIPSELLPKEPRLSDSQRKALQRLKWGVAKDLDYRGDGDDATVRSLSSSALIAPLDPSAPSAEAPEAKVQRFLAENRDLFLLKDPATETVAKSVQTDYLGITTVRLGQQLAGLEVWPGQITANISAQGLLTTLTGAYAPTPEGLILAPELSAEQAQRAALRHQSADETNLTATIRKTTLKIFADKGRKPEVAYEVSTRAPAKAETVFVSARNGAILLTIPDLLDAGTNTAVPDMFGVSRTINVLPSGSPAKYYIFDTSKAMWSETQKTGYIGILDTRANYWSSSASLTSGFDAYSVSA